MCARYTVLRHQQIFCGPAETNKYLWAGPSCQLMTLAVFVYKRARIFARWGGGLTEQQPLERILCCTEQSDIVLRLLKAACADKQSKNRTIGPAFFSCECSDITRTCLCHRDFYCFVPREKTKRCPANWLSFTRQELEKQSCKKNIHRNIIFWDDNSRRDFGVWSVPETQHTWVLPIDWIYFCCFFNSEFWKLLTLYIVLTTLTKVNFTEHGKQLESNIVFSKKQL